jgi:hypothetical protein
MFMVYVDDRILIDPDKEKVFKATLDMQAKFEVQDKGDLCDYLGVKVNLYTIMRSRRELLKSTELELPHPVSNMISFVHESTTSKRCIFKLLRFGDCKHLERKLKAQRQLAAGDDNTCISNHFPKVVKWQPGIPEV